MTDHPNMIWIPIEAELQRLPAADPLVSWDRSPEDLPGFGSCFEVAAAEGTVVEMGGEVLRRTTTIWPSGARAEYCFACLGRCISVSFVNGEGQSCFPFWI